MAELFMTFVAVVDNGLRAGNLPIFLRTGRQLSSDGVCSRIRVLEKQHGKMFLRARGYHGYIAVTDNGKQLYKAVTGKELP